MSTGQGSQREYAFTLLKALDRKKGSGALYAIVIYDRLDCLVITEFPYILGHTT